MRNPFSRKAEQENARATVAFPASIPKIGFLLQILIILTVLGSALSWYFIDTAAQEERRHMIAAMQGRAEALAGAVEGSARFLGYGSGGMLAEMARQPGIAWIAIVDSEGYIIQEFRPRWQAPLYGKRARPVGARNKNPGALQPR